MKTRLPGIAVLAVCLIWAAYELALWMGDLRFPAPMFEHLSWDENLYLPTLHRFQAALQAGDLRGFFHANEIFGYGSLFWQVYAIFAYPFRGFASHPESSAIFLNLRLLTLLFQLACLGCVAWLARRAEPRRGYGAAAAPLFLLPMCGLIPLYKPFSTDYLLTFLCLAGAIFSLRSVRLESRRGWRDFAVASILLGMALGTKAYALFLCPVLILFPLHVGARPFRLAPLLGGFVSGGIGLLVGFLASNTYLIGGSLQEDFLEKLAYQARGTMTDDYGHAIHPPGIGSRISHWLHNDASPVYFNINTIGISHEYIFPTLLLILALGLVYFGGRAIQAAVRGEGWDSRYLVGATGLLAFAATVLMTNRVWTWYLIPPVFFLSVGVAALVDDFVEKGRPGSPAARQAVAWGLLAANLVWLAPGWWSKTGEFRANRELAASIGLPFFAGCADPLFHSLHAKHPAVVAKSIGTPFGFSYTDPSLSLDDGAIRFCQSRSPLPCRSPDTDAILSWNYAPTEAERAGLVHAGFHEFWPHPGATCWVRSPLLTAAASSPAR